MADIGRHEEALGFESGDLGLHTHGRWRPQREPAVTMVIGVHIAERLLLADEERRCTMTEPFADLGQSNCDLADAVEH